MNRFYCLLFLTFLFSIQNSYAVVPSKPEKAISKKEIPAAKQQKKGFLKRLSEKMLVKKAYKMAQKMGFVAEDCDIIVKRNGEEIEAKILSVGINRIKYKNCYDNKQKAISIDKSEVASLRYTTGRVQLIKQKTGIDHPSENANTADEDTGNAWSIGLVLGLLLGLLGCLITLIAFSGAKRKEAVTGSLVGLLALIILSLIHI